MAKRLRQKKGKNITRKGWMSADADKENYNADTLKSIEGSKEKCKKPALEYTSPLASTNDDAFDKLLSSPPKRPVTYKSPSFWRQKLQRLEEERKEKKSKKKLDIYDITLSDDCTFLPEKKKKRKPRKRNKKPKEPLFDVEIVRDPKVKIRVGCLKSKWKKEKEVKGVSTGNMDNLNCLLVPNIAFVSSTPQGKSKLPVSPELQNCFSSSPFKQHAAGELGFPITDLSVIPTVSRLTVSQFSPLSSKEKNGHQNDLEAIDQSLLRHPAVIDNTIKNVADDELNKSIPPNKKKLTEQFGEEEQSYIKESISSEPIQEEDNIFRNITIRKKSKSRQEGGESLNHEESFDWDFSETFRRNVTLRRKSPRLLQKMEENADQSISIVAATSIKVCKEASECSSQSPIKSDQEGEEEVINDMEDASSSPERCETEPKTAETTSLIEENSSPPNKQSITPLIDDIISSENSIISNDQVVLNLSGTKETELQSSMPRNDPSAPHDSWVTFRKRTLRNKTDKEEQKSVTLQAVSSIKDTLNEVSFEKVRTAENASEIGENSRYFPLNSTFHPKASQTERISTGFGEITAIPILEKTACDPSPILRSPTQPANKSSEVFLKPPAPATILKRPAQKLLMDTIMEEILNEPQLPRRSARRKPEECSMMETTIGEASFNFKPGKGYNRSRCLIRQLQTGQFSYMPNVTQRGRNFQMFLDDVISMQDTLKESLLEISYRRTSRASRAKMSFAACQDRTLKGNKTMQNELHSTSRVVPIGDFDMTSFWQANGVDETTCSADGTTVLGPSSRELVLKKCGQKEPVSFDEHFNKKRLIDCKKIGEGVYGEIFVYTSKENGPTVLKVIPIENELLVNGERQKTFEEIFSEILITSELSNLRFGATQRCSGFVELFRVWCVEGKYPKLLRQLWANYDKAKGSENDNPIIFKDDQLYIIFELAHGGTDFEAFVFESAEQSAVAFKQLAFSLAVSERALEFEHRDLHWGNVLVQKTEEKSVDFVLDNQLFSIPTLGIKVTIIDFTLSRMAYENCAIFNDLSTDETLFQSKGDYQFEVYRLMLRETGNDWKLFRPKTNVFWLHYTLDKMINKFRYESKTSNAHKTGIAFLRKMYKRALSLHGASDLALSLF